MFRDALGLVPGLDRAQWTPRDLRHSFVSILSEQGVPLEEISRLMGHSGTAVTELVYRHELRPVLQSGATVMGNVFADLDIAPTVERPTETTASEPADGSGPHEPEPSTDVEQEVDDEPAERWRTPTPVDSFIDSSPSLPPWPGTVPEQPGLW